MTIKLQDLVSELKLDTKDFVKGSDTAVSALKGIGIGIGAVVAGATAVAAGLKKAADMTFEWAGEMDSVQDVMGGTNKQAAALNYTLRKSGTDTEQFISGMTILEKGLVKADGSLDATGKKLADFGISALDANGAVKEQAQLVEEISNKYNSFSTQQERVNFLTELFSRSGADLIDVFDTLAAEGGIDKVTEKVDKLGLAIGPGKYEQFTRTLEEVKLIGLSLAVSFVDKLMPALQGITTWWEEKGFNAFAEMKGKIDEQLPTWESISNTWTNHIAPVLTQLGELFNNINGALERLDPSTEKVAGKFTLLGIVQREAVAIATVMNGIMGALAWTLNLVNHAIEGVTNAFDRLNHWTSVVRENFQGVINTIDFARHIVSVFSGDVSHALSLANMLRNAKPPSGGRATGGAVLAGHSYNVVELSKPEVFTPFTAGRVDPAKPVVATFDENRLATVMGRVLGEQFQKRIA